MCNKATNTYSPTMTLVPECCKKYKMCDKDTRNVRQSCFRESFYVAPIDIKLTKCETFV